MTRNADGTVTFDVGDGDGDYDGQEVTAGSGDWTSAVLTRENSDDTDTVVLYTDIEEPDDSAVYGTIRCRCTGRSWPIFMYDGDDDVVDWPKSSASPPAPGTTWEYTGGDDGRAKTFSPALLTDVPGTFVCAGTPCTVVY